MSLFSKALFSAADWIDETFDLFSGYDVYDAPMGGTFGSAVRSAHSFLTEDIREIVGIGELGQEIYSAVKGQQGQPGYQLPMPRGTNPNFRSSVATGLSAARAVAPGNFGVTDRIVSRARMAANSTNPIIIAEVNKVKPTIKKRGVTTKLTEAKVSE